MVDKAAAVERLGIVKYDAWNEALHGVAWRDEVTVFPQAIGLASTWDPDLIHEVATAISTEARALYNAGAFGLTLWSPVINVARDPRWGRTQEAYGEDPFLTSRLAVSYVKGIQGDDPHYFRAIATPKHFALNNVEATRFTGSSDVPEELIRDYYLPHFQAAVVEGKAHSIMCAYNRINGTPACANPWLLDTVLREEWGFDGFVVSDCGGIGAMVWGHHVERSESDAVKKGLEAGCDLSCGNEYKNHVPDLVQRGALSEEDVNRAVGRVLEARFRLGMFDPPENNPYASIPMAVVDGPEHRKLALRAARQSLVLLQNDKLLPLDKAKVKKLAVIGPAADVFLHGSQGYHGTNNHLVSALEGLRRYAGEDLDITFFAGTVLPGGAGLPTKPVKSSMLRADGNPGLRAEYFSNADLQGKPAFTRQDPNIDFDWKTGAPDAKLPSDGFSVRWTGTFTPDESGHYLLSITGDDGYRVKLDGKPLVEDWTDHAPRTRGAVATLESGRPYELSIEYYERAGGASVRLSYAFVQDQQKDALRAAREADAVLFFAGVDELAADEEKDFADLSLPADQTKLLDSVIKQNPRTALVVFSGNPLIFSKTERRARALVQAWYPGQETGTALAEVLFGDQNPSGKTPITYYASLDDLPPMDDYDIRKGRTYMYLNEAPAFPFGHGLSYTTFKYASLSIAAENLTEADTLQFEVDLENAGTLRGAEVVQAYVRPPKGPKKVLRAFRRVELNPKARQTLSFQLPVSDLSHFDETKKTQVVDPGTYELLVGSSSGDIRQRKSFTVK